MKLRKMGRADGCAADDRQMALEAAWHDVLAEANADNARKAYDRAVSAFLTKNQLMLEAFTATARLLPPGNGHMVDAAVAARRSAVAKVDTRRKAWLTTLAILDRAGAAWGILNDIKTQEDREAGRSRGHDSGAAE